MSWYKKSKVSESINKELQSLVKSLEAQFSGLDLWTYCTSGDYIEIGTIRLPPEMQNQGIGHKVIRSIQDFAQRYNMPIVVRPEPDSRKKEKLLNFYRDLGFVHNKGRHRDYRLSTPFAPTMHWKPSFQER